MNEKYPTIKILSRYKNAREKVLCECSICGYKWYSKPTNLLSGYGCKSCGSKAAASKQNKSTDEFINELKSVNANILVLGEYINNKIPIKCKCLKCGKIWDGIPANLLRNEGCPGCHTSHGEKAIASWLDKNHIEYTPQARFKESVGVGGGVMPYDFYIESLNLFIEYQGNFHDNTVSLQTPEEYLIRVEHDRRKREYAESHGKFLEIWYYENLEEKLFRTINNIINPVTTTAA